MTTNVKPAFTNDFLIANKSNPGIIELPSGLQYQVTKEGSGSKPNVFSKVTCNYTGHLTTGQIFDQSKKPISFPLNQVIARWQEGLQLMSVGSIYRFFIHPQLGYGNRQVGNFIKPGSTLIFEVELLSFY
ncbi:MAG: FKBP-type peptidyl-prolyl cis-trans isomerase [Chryseobacterium sp.]